MNPKQWLSQFFIMQAVSKVLRQVVILSLWFFVLGAHFGTYFLLALFSYWIILESRHFLGDFQLAGRAGYTATDDSTKLLW